MLFITRLAPFTSNAVWQETFDAAVKENQDEFGMEVRTLS